MIKFHEGFSGPRNYEKLCFFISDTLFTILTFWHIPFSCIQTKINADNIKSTAAKAVLQTQCP